MQRDKSKIEAAPFRLSWPAIFGGMFAAAGVWLLLHAFGLAIGLSQLEPYDPSDLRATGIGTGIWTVIASMASLFVGGVVTARAAGLLGRSNAGLHGVVLWGVTTVGGLVLIASVVASLARGASGVTIETMTITRGQSPSAQMDQGTGQAMPEAGGATAQQAPTRQESMERVREVSAGAFWAAFSVMLLSLLSSVLGAIAGVTRRQRELSAQVAQFTPAPAATSRPLEVTM
jgi:hypothetical protein